MRLALALLTIISGLSQPALPQRPSLPSQSFREAHVLEVNLTEVLIPATVFRKDDHTVVRGLGKEDFRIFEERIEQPIVSVSEDDAPVALNILLDTSGSMKPATTGKQIRAANPSMLDQPDKLTLAISGIDALLGYVYREDQVSLTTFASKPVVVGDFGSTPQQIRRAMTRIKPGGLTSLNESVRFVARNMKRYMKDGGKLPDNRILLILSDGEDSTSWIWDSDNAVVEDIQESGLRVYAVGMIERTKLFRKLAETTGGKMIIVKDATELPHVIPDLLREMHTQYQVGFNSTQPLDGKYHKVKVTLKDHPEYEVFWKPGYTAQPR
jgi:Ca-activated chloride channel family protein